MFEVGKLCDESLDSFLSELEKVSVLDAEGEGEARRFFDHAVILRSTVLALRKLPSPGLDLVRLESLHSLDEATCLRLLQKKYNVYGSPQQGSQARYQLITPHLGPAVPEVNTLWFKLFLYHMTGYGPPSLLLTKGTTLKQLPRMFLGFTRLLVTSWLHEPAVIPIANILYVNAALQFSPVLIQAYGVHQPAHTYIIPFPFKPDTPTKIKEQPTDLMFKTHQAVKCLAELVDLEHNCGYLTFVNIGALDFGCPNRESVVRLGKNSRRLSSGFSKVTAVKTDSKNQSEPLSIMNENFSFKSGDDSSNKIIDDKGERPSNDNDHLEEKIDKSELERRLQSPVESHFALTPVTNSQSSSPANGFTSQECSTLLQEELDQLVIHEEGKEANERTGLELNLKGSVSVEQLASPGDENISMFTRDNESEADRNSENSKEEVRNDEGDNRAEVWTMLDCHFGVPLFDVNANTKICDTIVSGGLTEANSLEQLVESSRKLGSAVLDFISQCQYYPGENMEILKRGRLVPLPRHNLVFDNGRVSEWSGK
ncbi:hypothetical protein NQ318_015466 [Aromia moschata]|uniref:FAM91 C-terminal domain-containing protein n=1 Tax=Aromia moschata TaxID=1265417 RepID=A0AAV8XFI7_9CUCU|nr:hypothetical protein NQ318_015466 [Aromia moschata]